MITVAPSIDSSFSKSTIVEFVEDHDMGQDGLHMGEFVGHLRCEQLGDGVPAKLNWVPTHTLPEGALLEISENQERMESLEKGLRAGVPSDYDSGMFTCSPLILPGEILSRTIENPSLDIVEHGRHHLEVKSCPPMRRSRRIRTEPVAMFSAFTLAENNFEQGEETYAGNMISMLSPPPGLCPPPGTPCHGSVLHDIGACGPDISYLPESEVQAHSKDRFTCMRLGLATPKGTNRSSSLLHSPFGFEMSATVNPEQESTTCTSSDQEITSGPSSDEDPIAMNCITTLPSTVQKNEELKGDVSEGEKQGTASFPVGISQRRNRRTRTEPIQVCWGAPDEVVHVYLDNDSNSESDAGAAMPGPMVPPPGLGPSYGTCSVGSALHDSGKCRPCAWYWKPGSCQNGSACMHCHLCPEGEIKNRKKAKLSSMRLGLASPKSHKPIFANFK